MNVEANMSPPQVASALGCKHKRVHHCLGPFHFQFQPQLLDQDSRTPECRQEVDTAHKSGKEDIDITLCRFREFMRLVKFRNEPEKNDNQLCPPISPCHPQKQLAVPEPEHHAMALRLEKNSTLHNCWVNILTTFPPDKQGVSCRGKILEIIQFQAKFCT